jgi:hypothetical protein
MATLPCAFEMRKGVKNSKRKMTKKQKLQKKKRQTIRKSTKLSYRHKRMLGGSTTNKEFRKLNCSPAVHGKTTVEESCYTDDILNKLKDAHNAKHSDTPIHASTSKEIWGELKQKQTSCTAEDCWLDVITDHSEKAKIDKYSFAPDQPNDWKGEKNPWLSNFDIFNVLSQYEIPYPHFKIIGPTPIDFDAKPTDMGGRCVWNDLCDFSIKHYLDKKITKIGVVFNLDEHNKGGSHWVSMFIDLEHHFIFYLDSAGDKIPKRINAFVKRVTEQASKENITLTFYENSPIEHQKGASECGVYALYFIITMLTKKIEDTTFSDHMELIKLFKDKRIPDSYVTPFRNKYFNVPDSFLKK